MRLFARWLTCLFILLSLGLALWTPRLYAQDKTLVWERFDVTIAVQPDGVIEVAEQQQIRFTQGSFQFGFRDIPIHNLSRIDHWAVTDGSGHTYQQAQQGEAPYTLVVEENKDHAVVHWYFPPLSNRSETYTLRYQVHDALRVYPKGDQLWWKAIYGDRGFPALAGRVQVSTPPRALIEQRSAYLNGKDARDAATATVAADKQSIVFQLGRQLASDEEFEVRVQFAHGIVAAQPPTWQAAVDAEAAHQAELLAYQQKWGPLYNFIFCGLGLLFTFGGPAGLYALWYTRGRDKPTAMVADYLPEAPDDLPPALVGALLDERVDFADIVATLVDLAQRQALTITAVGSTDFIYRRARTDVTLRPYEQAVLDVLFAAGEQTEVRLSQVQRQFTKQFGALKQRIYQALLDEGYFPHNPERVRHRYGCIGAAGLVFGLLLGVCLLTLYVDVTVAGILPGIGLAVTALGALILARAMPRKTAKGADAAARWRAFKQYLQNIEKYSDVAAQKAIWERWLPYAIAFGIDETYLRQFAAVDAPAPTWYFPSTNAYDDALEREQHTPHTATQGKPSQPTAAAASAPQVAHAKHHANGGLNEASRNLGGSLSQLSTSLGAMLTGTSNALAGYSPSAVRSSSTSSSSSSSSSDSGWSSSGSSFSGGGSSGGGGGGGGSGGFG